uniref:Uncharacterized protein n=1 Tax=Anguilla anguilla TaxID=7936 RepID=A0A0E9P8P5_ANGAN
MECLIKFLNIMFSVLLFL